MSQDTLYTTQPLHVDIVFYMQRPKASKYKNLKWHTTRPDCDNMEKPLLDICKSIVFKDDSIVCSVSKKKVYSELPRTEFSFTILKDSNEKKEQP